MTRSSVLSIAALTAAAALAVLPARAVDRGAFMIDTTGQLAALCSTSPEDPLHAAAIHMCQGYMLGAHHFHAALVAADATPIYCPPAAEAPSRNEVVAAFVAWVGENPEIASTEALDGLMTWAETAYACQ